MHPVALVWCYIECCRPLVGQWPDIDPDGAAAMGHISPALKDFAEAADFLRGAFSPDFEAIGEVTTAVPWLQLLTPGPRLSTCTLPSWHQQRASW